MTKSDSRDESSDTSTTGNHNEFHRIFIADARDMRELEDHSVHLVITSPPYWQLKDYGNPNQVGFSDTYEQYINHMNLVWMECQRVLHPGCRLCVNIGDQFARSAYYGRYKVIPIRTEIVRFCETVGFDYMGAIIWQKVTTTNTSGGGAIMGSFPYPRNGIVRLDYEFILLFRKHGKAPPPIRESRDRSRLNKEDWNTYFSGHWNFPGERQSDHLAMFPVELPHRLIRMFSFVGDTVLDPFVGSGTTTLAAHHNKRHSIGYEINRDFRRVIRKKVGKDIQITAPRHRKTNFDLDVQRLPYIFRDPVPIDRKIDPRRNTFGSKINASNKSQSNLAKVVDVPEPNVVVLNNGNRVKLLGIRVLKRKRQAAITKLKALVDGKKVFIGSDDKTDDSFGYLYLQNKTPINRHLIRSGLVSVDTSYDYRFKKSFVAEANKLGK